MVRSLLINASPDFIEKTDTSGTFELRIGRHGQNSGLASDALGDPTAYAVMFHLCVSGVQPTSVAAKVGADGSLQRAPVVSDQFIADFTESGGFSVYFIDYFNHEIPGHPDSFRLNQLEPHVSTELKVNPTATGESLHRFVESFGKQFGRLCLRVVKKARAKVLVARSDGQPVVLLAGPNTLIMPAPLDAKALPGMVGFLLDSVLADFVPAVSSGHHKSSRLLTLERAIADELKRHSEVVAQLQLEIEVERQAIARVSRLTSLHGDDLLSSANELLAECFDLSINDLTSVVDRPAIFVQPGNVAVFASDNQSSPNPADFAHLLQAMARMRQTGVEPESAVILFNRMAGDSNDEGADARSRILNEYARQTGIHPISGQEMANLVNGAREGQINTTDLTNYLKSLPSSGTSNTDQYPSAA